MRFSSAAVAVAAAGLIAVSSGCGASQLSASVTLCHDYFAWVDKINPGHADPLDHKIGPEFEQLNKNANKAVRHWVARTMVFSVFAQNDSGAQQISDEITMVQAAEKARAACNGLRVHR